MEFSDTDLIQMLSKADKRAFDFLYRKYYNMVRFLVEKNSGSQEDASDLFQDVLIIVYEKIRDNKLSISCSLKTYLYSIARNQWLKKLKSNRYTESIKTHEDFILVDEEIIEKPEVNIQSLLDEIGDACRKLLVLFYYRKLSMEEICTELNYSNADSVKNQKYKCIQRLKKMVR